MSKKLSWTSLWYTGAVATTLQKSRQRRREQVALFVTATGGHDAGTRTLVTDLLQRSSSAAPWKVYCVTAQNPRDKNNNTASAVTYIQCDLSNPNDIRKKLSTLTDVTHLFYVALTDREVDQADKCLENSSEAFRNVIRTVMSVSPKLKHVGLQISKRHCSGACKTRLSTITGVSGLPPIDEDDDEMSPRWNSSMEDVLVEEVGKKNSGVNWAVHHPSTTPPTLSAQLEDALATASGVESEQSPDSMMRCRENCDVAFEFRDAAEAVAGSSSLVRC